jgi:hypothetical protein
MSYSCAQWRGEIGAYIVGALDGRARARVSRHLVACPGCRAEYDELLPVRDWLSQLTAVDGSPVPVRSGRREWRIRPSLPAAWSGNAPVPHPYRHARRPDGGLRVDVGPRPDVGLRRAAGLPPYASARQEAGPGWAARRTARRPGRLLALPARGWRWLLTAGAGLAAGAAIAGILLLTGPTVPTYHAVNTVSGVSGQAQLHSKPTGTQIDLTATGLPAGERCILVAVARNGADIAGTWDATYRGSAQIAGTSAYPASQLTALRIESDSGLVLLSIRV